MRRSLKLSLVLLAVPGLFGQIGPHASYGSKTGYGNVVFPGTPTPVVNPAATFPARLGAVVAGAPLGVNRGGRGGRGVIIPFAYPVYVGGYGYGYGYGYDPAAQQAQQAPPTVVYAYPPQQQQPQVIINQNFASPPPQQDESSGNTTFYQAPSRTGAEAGATPAGVTTPVFLIAYADHSVYTAVAYWVEDEALHYITTDGKHNQASLTLIDRKMSEDLNKERDVDFRLPK